MSIVCVIRLLDWTYACIYKLAANLVNQALLQMQLAAWIYTQGHQKIRPRNIRPF